MRIVCVVVLLLSPLFFYAQPLSKGAKISLVTCDPGGEIYALHGHSAIRVQDPLSGMDLICNWGVFDPGDSELDFSISFAKGQMDYLLDLQSYSSFKMLYELEQRGMRELVLNLTMDQKQRIWQRILENYEPENRAYRYDFFFANCATLIRDLIIEILGDELQLYQHPESNQLSFRNLIDENLAFQPWSDFGIDLSLGAKTDQIVSNNEIMFLPLKMEEIFENSEYSGMSLVSEKNVLLDYPEARSTPSFLTKPATIFWIMLLMGAAIVFFQWERAAKIFDALYFTILGMAGVLVLFLWFGTEHTTTDQNFNLFWANPVHFILPLLLIFRKSRHYFNRFFLFLALFYFGFILFWFFLPQDLNGAARPLILLIALRYYYWFRQTKSDRVAN